MGDKGTTDVEIWSYDAACVHRELMDAFCTAQLEKL